MYEDITQATRAQLLHMQEVGAICISPSALALAVYQEFSTGGEDDHITYLALEHCKQFSRKLLASKFDVTDEDVGPAQDDLFSWQLQEYYPTPKPDKKHEPVYKRMGDMTWDEITFNVENLRKSAKALMAHAACLEAYRDLMGKAA